jgi:hypothetical protein
MITWSLVEMSGWSLEYIRELSLEDLKNYLSIEEAKSKIREKQSKKK